MCVFWLFLMKIILHTHSCVDIKSLLFTHTQVSAHEVFHLFKQLTPSWRQIYLSALQRHKFQDIVHLEPLHQDFPRVQAKSREITLLSLYNYEGCYHNLCSLYVYLSRSSDCCIILLVRFGNIIKDIFCWQKIFFVKKFFTLSALIYLHLIFLVLWK